MDLPLNLWRQQYHERLGCRWSWSSTWLHRRWSSVIPDTCRWLHGPVPFLVPASIWLCTSSVY